MPNLLRMLMDPLTDYPSRLARQMGEVFDPATGGAGGDRGYVRPFLAGALEGVGDLASSSTSPASLGMAAAGISPSISRALRVGRLNRAIGASDDAIRGLAAENAAWMPKGGTAGLQDLRIEERLRHGYDVPNNARAQELERLRKMIEDEYLMRNYGSLER